MAPLSFSSRNLFSLFHKPSVIPFEFWGQHSSALFSTHIVGDTPIIVRDFIHKALYDPNVGYFSQKSASVGVLDRSIKFNQLQGRKAYMKHLDKIYKQSDVSWFTPVELFKPWYAHGIAEAILRTTNLSVPLKIYEIGGGSGTCAKGILDYIKLNAPTRVYDNISYTSVEISSSLAAKQIQTVGEVDSHLSKFRVECRDAADRSGWGDVNEQPCWVIMLELNHDERNWVVGEKLTPLKMPITNIWHASNEHFTILQEHNVLDNLPHDLIYSENQMSPWMEVWVESKQGEKLSELYRPIQDSLIKSCMEIIDLPNATTGGSRVSSAMKSIWAKVFPKPRWCWLPTGCLKLLEVLHGALPKMSLIASDFSYLPDVKIPGERAPLVSTKKDGSSSDYNSYLDAKGDADIFFPTDFLLLEQIDHYCSGWMKQQKDDTSLKRGKKRRTLSLDTAAFMEEFGLPTKTRTKDGYNPLLDDFKNTKFYLSVPTHNIK